LNLNRMHTNALSKELKATAYEYITNRRYETNGQIYLVMARDFFEKAAAVQASFDAKDIAVPNNELLASPLVEDQKDAASAHQLVLKEEDGPRYQLEVKIGGAPICIGRAAGNRLRIDDQSISRIHCSFSLQGNGKYFIADLNSSNGTSVNGNHLRANEAREIKKGDVIQVGDIRLSVEEVG
jgi:hypothetical protein